MKIHATKIGLATAIVFAAFWVICSLLVMTIPRGMMRMSGDMMHSNLSNMTWSMDGGGLFVGLLAWTLISGVVAWAIAAVYNRLIG